MNKLKLLCLLIGLTFAANASAKVHQSNRFISESEQDFGVSHDFRHDRQHQNFSDFFDTSRFGFHFEGRNGHNGANEHAFDGHEFGEHGHRHGHGGDDGNDDGEDGDDDVSPVPEAEAYQLMLIGLGVLGFVATRRKRSEI